MIKKIQVNAVAKKYYAEFVCVCVCV